MVTPTSVLAALLAPQCARAAPRSAAPAAAALAVPAPIACDHRDWIDAIVPDATAPAYREVGWRNRCWRVVQEARAPGIGLQLAPPAAANGARQR
jgi:hypothetical protein